MEPITLKTLAQASPQQVFDQAVRHLLTQKVRSAETYDGGRRYRHGSRKCVAGAFIDDSEYTPEMESNTWSMLVLRKLVPDAHQGLMCELQRIHDSGTSWVIELKNEARYQRLSPAVIEELDTFEVPLPMLEVSP